MDSISFPSRPYFNSFKSSREEFGLYDEILCSLKLGDENKSLELMQKATDTEKLIAFFAENLSIYEEVSLFYKNFNRVLSRRVGYVESPSDAECVAPLFSLSISALNRFKLSDDEKESIFLGIAQGPLGWTSFAVESYELLNLQERTKQRETFECFIVRAPVIAAKLVYLFPIKKEEERSDLFYLCIKTAFGKRDKNVRLVFDQFDDWNIKSPTIRDSLLDKIMTVPIGNQFVPLQLYFKHLNQTVQRALLEKNLHDRVLLTQLFEGLNIEADLLSDTIDKFAALHPKLLVEAILSKRIPLRCSVSEIFAKLDLNVIWKHLNSISADEGRPEVVSLLLRASPPNVLIEKVKNLGVEGPDLFLRELFLIFNKGSSTVAENILFAINTVVPHQISLDTLRLRQSSRGSSIENGVVSGDTTPFSMDEPRGFDEAVGYQDLFGEVLGSSRKEIVAILMVSIFIYPDVVMLNWNFYNISNDEKDFLLIALVEILSSRLFDVDEEIPAPLSKTSNLIFKKLKQLESKLELNQNNKIQLVQLLISKFVTSASISLKKRIAGLEDLSHKRAIAKRFKYELSWFFKEVKETFAIAETEEIRFLLGQFYIKELGEKVSYSEGTEPLISVVDEFNLGEKQLVALFAEEVNKDPRNLEYFIEIMKSDEMLAELLLAVEKNAKRESFFLDISHERNSVTRKKIIRAFRDRSDCFKPIAILFAISSSDSLVEILKNLDSPKYNTLAAAIAEAIYRHFLEAAGSSVRGDIAYLQLSYNHHFNKSFSSNLLSFIWNEEGQNERNNKLLIEFCCHNFRLTVGMLEHLEVNEKQCNELFELLTELPKAQFSALLADFVKYSSRFKENVIAGVLQKLLQKGNYAFGKSLLQAITGPLSTVIQNITLNKEVAFQFALELAEAPSPYFCEVVGAIDLESAEKQQLLKMAAAKDGLTIAASVKNCLIKEPLFLAELADVALQQNPKVVQEIANFEEEALKILSETLKDRFVIAYANGDEMMIERYLLEFPPKAIVNCAEYMLEKHIVNKERIDSYVLYLTCKLFERAARKFQKGTFFKKAMKARLCTDRLPLTLFNRALSNFEEKLNSPVQIETTFGALNYGTTWGNMGSEELKGGSIRLRQVVIDGIEKRIVDCKVSYNKADEIREYLLTLASNTDLLKKLEDSSGADININPSEAFAYYPCVDGKYDTQSLQKIEAGSAIKLSMDGVGTLTIGAEQAWGSVSNLLRITLPITASLRELQRLLSVVGMANALTASSPYGVKRTKINALIHFYFPSIAAKWDLEAEYHQMPIEQLLQNLEDEEKIPGFALKIKKLLPRLQSFELLPGESHFMLDGLSKELELLGARGLMYGMGYKKNFSDVAHQLASIKKGGFLASQTRFEVGLSHDADGKLLVGSSGPDDLKANSADNVFFRLITEKTISEDEQLSGAAIFWGSIQVILKTELLNRLGYALSEDCYGLRNRQCSNSSKKNFYLERGNIYDFVKENQRKWHSKNEFMVKHFVPSDLIAFICYQDQRKLLMADLVKKNPTFFDSCHDEGAKISYITQNLYEVKKCLGIDEDLYKNFSVDRHWTVNPLEVIKRELTNGGIDPNSVEIIEADSFGKLPWHLCNGVQQRSEELEFKVRSSAGKFSTFCSSEAQRPSAMLEGIKASLRIKETTELLDLLEEKSLDQIKELQKQCALHLANVDFSGCDSLNRQLLTAEWNEPLHDPAVIIALFALEELERRNLCKNLFELNQFNSRLARKNAIFKISDSVYYGFLSHPLLLEKLPVNLNIDPPQKELFLIEYLRRSQSSATFIPVRAAIDLAFASLKPSITVSGGLISSTESEFDKGYDPSKWQNEYQELFRKIETHVRRSDENGLLNLAATQYTPRELRAQVKKGVEILLEKEKCHVNELSADELCKTVIESVYLLHPLVSHLFFDRIHLAAILKDEELSETLLIKSAPFPIRTLIVKMIERLKNGVTLDNAIAAEQLYLRLVMIGRTLK